MNRAYAIIAGALGIAAVVCVSSSSRRRTRPASRAASSSPRRPSASCRPCSSGSSIAELIERRDDERLRSEKLLAARRAIPRAIDHRLQPEQVGAPIPAGRGVRAGACGSHISPEMLEIAGSADAPAQRRAAAARAALPGGPDVGRRVRGSRRPCGVPWDGSRSPSTRSSATGSISVSRWASVPRPRRSRVGPASSTSAPIPDEMVVAATSRPGRDPDFDLRSRPAALWSRHPGTLTGASPWPVPSPRSPSGSSSG